MGLATPLGPAGLAVRVKRSQVDAQERAIQDAD